MVDIVKWCCVGAAIASAACGGKAVIDGSATGGGGGVSTATSTGSTGSTGSTTSTTSSTQTTTGVCDSLEQDLTNALVEAQTCDPLINAIQCSGSKVAFDQCGCEVVTNDLSDPDEAIAAYDAWVAAGCGPYDCDSCPPPPDSPWFCEPSSSLCQPAYE